MIRWIVGAGLLAGCLSGISENSDGVASIEIRLPANFFLEQNQTVTLAAVAKNADGDSLEAAFRWRTADSTISLDSVSGTIRALTGSGKARVQVALLGQDSVFSVLDSLSFTLTPAADSLAVTSADSIEVRTDTTGVVLSARLDGGSPRVPVLGRPVTFRIIEPAPADTPSVAFATGQVVDSTLTAGATGAATVTVRGRVGRPVPDRAVVEVNAFRADGRRIPGSGRRIVLRFLHGSA